MGNTPTKGEQKKGKKYVHWSNADKPSPPGKPQLVPGTPHNQPDVVTIRWERPASDGGAPITGYLVEHRRTGSPHWVRATPDLVTTTELTLSGLEPGWRYQFRVSAENVAGMSEPGELSEPLTVTLQRSAATAPNFLQELKDTIALENEKAEFMVNFRGTPTPKIAWFKDGFEIFSSRRTKILTENEQSSLVIFQTAFNDEGEIKCTATNRVGHVVTKAKLRLEAPPRIRLPRQYEDGLLFEMDEIIRLKVSVAGRPLPRVTWFHNGDQVVFGGRYEVANTDRYSSLRVGEARRNDRGEYQVKATNRLGEDVVSFLVTVTDRPVPPGKAKVIMTLGRSVTLSWSKPDDDGGCKIGNYIVEYYRLGWNVWLKAATCRQLQTTLGDLIEGSEYKFRVKAENPYGVSDPSGETEVVFIPDPKRGIMEAPARGTQMPIDPEIAAELLKEDRKRHRPPSREVAVSKRDRHLDSSMEYPSSDPESFEDQNKTKRGFPSQSPKTLQKLKRNRDVKEIPLTVLEYNSVTTDSSVDQSNKYSGAKTSDGVQFKTDARKILKQENNDKNPYKADFKIAQDSMSVPKTKPSSRVVKPSKDDQEDMDLIPEVYSLQIPVGRQLAKKIEVTSKQEKCDDEDNRMIHGSSEMMLVLLPHTRDIDSGSDDGQHADFCRSFTEENNLGVAPPMSLSSPELGCGEPFTMTALRNAVSSTELLHARAMERLYLEAEAEEVATSLRRRHNIERKRSFERGSEPNQQTRRIGTNRAKEDTLKEKVQRLDATNTKEELIWHEKMQSPNLTRRNEQDQHSFDVRKKLSYQLTDEEKEEELEFARLRERIAQSLQEDSKEVEREMNYRLEDAPNEDEDIDEEEGTLDDEELEEESEEESYDEEEEEEEDENDVNPEEESSDEGDESYRPLTNQAGRRTPPLRSMDAKTFSDEEEEPYHPRSMVPRPLAVKELPPPVPIHRDILTVKTLDDKAREITPPIRYEPKSDLQPKPILKTTSKFGKDDTKTKPKPPSPRASTPFGSNEQKPKTPIIKSIINKIEKPFKRGKTPPAKETDSKAVVLRQKKGSPPKPAGKQSAQEAERREGDVGLSAAEIARKRRLKDRQSSLEEDQEANKVIIDLYSDIVKEYGVPKKSSPILFMNTDDLKAAAESTLEKYTSLSPEPFEETQLDDSSYRKKGILNTNMGASSRKPESINSASPSPIQRPPSSASSKDDEKYMLPRSPIGQKLQSATRKPESINSASPSPIQGPPSSASSKDDEKYTLPRSPIEQRVQRYQPPTPTQVSRNDEYDDDYSDEQDDVKWAYTPRNVMARIRRSLTPKRSFRRQRPNNEEIIKQAESRVHYVFTYLADLSMLLVATWLYLFKDERLAIPVLLLLVYRQMHEAILSWIPKRWRRQ